MDSAFILNSDTGLQLCNRGKTLPVLTIEMIEPSETDLRDGRYYALRVTRYRDDAIVCIWEKTFWHRTPETEAIENMVELTDLFTVGITEANK